MFDTVLIANRGAIACRVIRSLKALGLRAVAVHSEADADSLHVAMADASVCIGPAPAAQSYLDAERILAAARASGAGAIHPGYGFLSENPGFAEAVEAAGLAFIGPTPAQMRAFGLKHTARALAERHGVPLLPGSGLLASLAVAEAEAARIGYPVMLKSTAGGGGIGMRLVRSAAELAPAFEAVQRLAAANFKDAGLFVEKFVERARHIEVQLFGDGRGQVVALGERDCSAQRRHQKVIEETPAPHLDAATRAALLEAAVRLGRAVGYRSAGTVEFVLDADSQAFYFLEVNTRLQVEHGVTEQVTGIDLVAWMVRLARGDAFALDAPAPRGASVQVRLYAEDPARNFQPSAGLLTEVAFPDSARVETWVATGTEVPPHYDPMIAKLIVTGVDRADAVDKLQAALAGTRLAGIETNLRYLRAVAASAVFTEGRVVTRSLADFAYRPRAFEVLEAGVQTTVQDWPGRTGYWDVGVPPSGPMDDLAFRLANRLVGNAEGAAGLENTLDGPTLRFHHRAVVAVCGAAMPVTLDGAPLAPWQAHEVPAGGTLRIAAVPAGGDHGGHGGSRSYLAVRGGIDVPAYLGSRATFTLGQFGGHAGRALRVGDMLHIAEHGGLSGSGSGGPSGGSSGTGTDTASVRPRPVDEPAPPPASTSPAPTEAPAGAAPAGIAPAYPARGAAWRIAVLYGPHGAPDFFTEGDIATFFGAAWQVHYHSSRTGVRLIGPRPAWARHDGGEAGLHPSNIHDNAYAIGAIDFTGDMPVILGPDGPSLGGFVCPAVVVAAERWKLGQLRPGDSIRFHRVSQDEAAALQARQDAWVRTLHRPAEVPPVAESAAPAPAAEAEPLPGGPLATEPVSADPYSAGPLATEPLSTEPVSTGPFPPPASPILFDRPASPGRPGLVIRQAGDRYLLVELGALQLDIALRMRIHALHAALQARREQRSGGLGGIVDLTPGIRSLQLHFDPRHVARASLVQAVADADDALGSTDDLVVPSRTVYLPLSWDDSATRLAIDKYMQSVRPDAPWCPSNIEFIRRINGLDSIEAVQRIVFDASYLVLGLGDVYLGAPVATPVDPRHRLVTTKYNPARTWTPENAVGIGGAYLCVYGMEGPGGYQFVGRTLQMWNRWRAASSGVGHAGGAGAAGGAVGAGGSSAFEAGKPWLLRCFDQIRFYPVSEKALVRIRRDFPAGRYPLRIEHGRFAMRDYSRFLQANAGGIEDFKRNQQAAFDAERERWRQNGQADFVDEPGPAAAPPAAGDLPDGARPVCSPVPGSVWKVAVQQGDTVAEGVTLVVVESMKMEFAVVAPCAGQVWRVGCTEGGAVGAGQAVVVLLPLAAAAEDGP